jgi:uncharacterized protein
MTTATALFEAIRAKDAVGLEEVLRGEPGLLDAKDERGLSPLMVAIYHGAVEVVELLRRWGASSNVFEASAIGDVGSLRDWLRNEPESVSAYSVDGFKPLHLASFFGQPEAVGILLEQGADLSAWSANDLRNQALHAAIAGRQDSEVIHLLLARGADVNAVAHGGYTPLHLAASRGDRELISELVGRGARATRTEDGRRLSEIAAAYGHPETAAWLEEIGLGF